MALALIVICSLISSVALKPLCDVDAGDDGDAIIFPPDEEQCVESEQTTSSTVPPELSDEVKCWQNRTLYWPQTRKCYPPASKGPCDENEWFILVKSDQQPECMERPCQPQPECLKRPCPYNQMLQKTGQCEKLDCGEERVLMYNSFGIAECLCRYDSWEIEGECHELFRQGPCQEGQILTLSTTGSAVCSANVCSQDGFVLYNGTCSELGSHDPCSQKTATSTLGVDLNLQLSCTDGVRQVARVPYNCGPTSPMR